jgi:hypothetical protein
MLRDAGFWTQQKCLLYLRKYIERTQHILDHQPHMAMAVAPPPIPLE